jgi:hypothetical protein
MAIGRAAEQRGELAPPHHSITSSARASKVAGISRPCSGVAAARQPYREHRTRAQFARHRHVAAHHARELAGDCEPETGAAEALRGDANRQA